MKILFCCSLIIIFYTFIGYGLLLFLLVKVKRLFQKARYSGLVLPTCTVVVAAFNEESIISDKIFNTLQLNYPTDRLKYMFVTDGSTDRTPDIVLQHPEITLLHQTMRQGKIAAVHRAMEEIDSEIIVFTDANTMVNKNALLEICNHYNDPKIGAVAGEKRVYIEDNSDATAGEGFYWKYESKLKAWDAELYSVVGAAGELFSIRKDLYRPVPKDSILDDFMISMRIAERGYKIAYEPKAYAIESASTNISEELKRKVRISAGAIQSIIYLKGLFNIFKYPVLSFQYISHRVLRWTITPFLLILAFVLNIIIVRQEQSFFFIIIGLIQLIFYVLALAGWIVEARQLRIKALFIPYYFCLMNYAVIAGIFRFFNAGQNVKWDKAERKQIPKAAIKSA
jgi:biofilm PGA synthesis N-glycosyltransferase PgaC